MNKPLDDLLRETLRARAADQAAACLDAERAAAFIDGTMSARARDEAEVHLADCPRCQALLGALVRTTPPPVERAWWRRPAMAWLAPLTAAATVLAIWINVSDNASVVPVQPSREEAALASTPVAPAPAPVTTQPQSPSLRDAGDARARASDEKRVRETAEPSAKARTFPSEAAAPVAGLDARQIPPPSPVAEPPSAPPAPAPAASFAPPSPAADAESARARLARPPAFAENSTFAARRLTPLTTIVSSNRTSQWRIGTGGELQHSTDGGVMWRTQTTGVTAAPAAGSSPSPSVCWLVGREGLVLITTDEGQSWRRVPFPVATDLVSVRATDHQTATVVTSDGRTFVTSDGGRSWRR